MCEEGRDGVYVIGQAGLEEELEGEGIQWKGGTVCLSSSFRGAASNERLVHRGWGGLFTFPADDSIWSRV